MGGWAGGGLDFPEGLGRVANRCRGVNGGDWFTCPVFFRRSQNIGFIRVIFFCGGESLNFREIRKYFLAPR